MSHDFCLLDLDSVVIRKKTTGTALSCVREVEEDSAVRPLTFNNHLRYAMHKITFRNHIISALQSVKLYYILG